jgi:lipid II:glycine glycyltransferase (peptidoglycan interpeptide bridge formation enzyme)
MRSKTRYNIHLAERSGVRVRPGQADDQDLLYALYAETSVRDGFVIRSPGYYREAWGSFITAGMAQPFVAEIDSHPVAAIVVYRFADRAWYLYGMSRALHRERMPNHLLQWEAIRWAKQQGCTAYDLWGAPDRVDESDPLWGVYRFKQGFGAGFVRTIGAWDYTVRRPAYWAYSAVLPRLLVVMRRRGRAATRHTLES